MKKLLAALGAAVMLLGLFGVAQATAEPGPNGNNDKGLCTAFFNGQKAGHDRNGSPGPFAALATAAGVDPEAETPLEEIASTVYEWCLTLAGSDGNGIVIGGNADANGRWTCEVDEADATVPEDDTYTCTNNPDKGKPAA